MCSRASSTRVARSRLAGRNNALRSSRLSIGSEVELDQFASGSQPQQQQQQADAASGGADSLFPPEQDFFHKFLEAADNYKLSRLVGCFALRPELSALVTSHLLRTLSCKITELCDISRESVAGEPSSTTARAFSAVPADVRKTFTSRVMKLQLLARFLGFLVFSPNWEASRMLQHSNSAGYALSIKESIA